MLPLMGLDSVLQLRRSNANILNTTFSGISVSSNITSDNGILKTSHCRMTIQGITLESCKASFGLAFCYSTVAISHSDFRDNEVNSAEVDFGFPHSFGGILYFDKYSSITVTCSTFNDNNIRSLSEREYYTVVGGVIIMLGSSGDSKFIFCNFLNNTGSGDIKGAAIHIYSQHNTYGATIYIHRCTFINNSVFTGGAVRVDSAIINIDISYSNFTANVAHREGGAISVLTLNGNVIVSGSTFWGNVVSSNTIHGIGGAVCCYTRRDLKLVNNNFTNNEASSGGAIYVTPCRRLIVQTSIFTSNKANNGNGGAMAIPKALFSTVSHHLYIIKLNITESTYINNIATVDGGGLYVEGIASVGSYNIIIFVIITSNYFLYNQAKTGNGGALALVNVANVTVDTNDFYNNNLANNGGALYVMSESSDSHCSCMDSEHNLITNISECAFSYNEAVRGGAIYMAGSQPISISTSKNITENLAKYGGAVFSNSGRLYISNEVKITNNTADTSGGAVYLNNSELICQDGGKITLEMNMAKAQGGGICSSSSLLIINSTVKHPSITSSSINFLQNYGKKGGGLYLCKGSIIYVINYQMSDSSAINFIQNTATFGSDLFIPGSTIYTGDGATHMSDFVSPCFIQPHNMLQNVSFDYTTNATVYFELNKANFESQLNVLKTRFVTCNINEQPAINESDLLKAVSNLQDVNIGTLLHSLCFCRYGLPDCSYTPPPVEVVQNNIGIDQKLLW